MPGNSFKSIASNRPCTANLDVFDTSIGWFGVLFRETTICRVRFGFRERAEVVLAFEQTDRFVLSEVAQPWRQLLETYSSGSPVSFSDLEIDSCWMSPFQKRVIDECRIIPYGSTVTYGRLASRAGSQGAARAVGSTMRTNRFPIIVPCHRVIGANSLGGFSASRGIETKQLLLNLEGAGKVDGQRSLFD